MVYVLIYQCQEFGCHQFAMKMVYLTCRYTSFNFYLQKKMKMVYLTCRYTSFKFYLQKKMNYMCANGISDANRQLTNQIKIHFPQMNHEQMYFVHKDAMQAKNELLY